MSRRTDGVKTAWSRRSIRKPENMQHFFPAKPAWSNALVLSNQRPSQKPKAKHVKSTKARRTAHSRELSTQIMASAVDPSVVFLATMCKSSLSGSSSAGLRSGVNYLAYSSDQLQLRSSIREQHTNHPGKKERDRASMQSSVLQEFCWP